VKAYWDSSALVKAAGDTSLRQRLGRERGYTRSHAVNELFSAFTSGKNISIKLDADDAAKLIESIAADLDFVELTVTENLSALRIARQYGVRGGRIHDLIHAKAAEKSGATELLTADKNDFLGLSATLLITQV
jgi:predicted nucleic acid-binding protein